VLLRGLHVVLMHVKLLQSVPAICIRDSTYMGNVAHVSQSLTR
jgi:hypothetical protein